MDRGSSRRKIFGIGLSKTGTSSLCEALEILGYRSVHNPTDGRSIMALLTGNLRCPAIEDNDAVCDIIFSRYFRELDRLYPGSLFILTERERQAWHASCAKHWSQRSVRRQRLWNEDLVDFNVYGTMLYQERLFDDTYSSHYSAVRQHFSKTHQLLCINICRGDGWSALCQFLGKDIPSIPFPHICPDPWIAPIGVYGEAQLT
ncbi:sulfotransferase family protein [Dyella nitratireducens]|uniref:sulfotransferase family protein n=1 Tax=Dyella nitratireducens TaxID=1849580 RepID=UPI00166D361A|nr:sulfotransferase family protein [Dyella nitratireducens]